MPVHPLFAFPPSLPPFSMSLFLISKPYRYFSSSSLFFFRLFQLLPCLTPLFFFPFSSLHVFISCLLKVFPYCLRFVRSLSFIRFFFPPLCYASVSAYFNLSFFPFILIQFSSFSFFTLCTIPLFFSLPFSTFSLSFLSYHLSYLSHSSPISLIFLYFISLLATSQLSYLFFHYYLFPDPFCFPFLIFLTTLLLPSFPPLAYFSTLFFLLYFLTISQHPSVD